MGHFLSICPGAKKDEGRVGSNRTGVDQLNFKKFGDDESCKSGDNHFNLGEFKDQDDVLTNQDVDSIGGTLSDNSFVRETIRHTEYQATISRALFLAERLRPDILQTIMLMIDPSFGVINHGNGMQAIDARYAYLMDSGSTLHIPVQEQMSGELDSHNNMPELFFCTRAKKLVSSSDDMSLDDSLGITSVYNNDPTVDISQEPPKAEDIIAETFLFVDVMCMTFFELTTSVA